MDTSHLIWNWFLAYLIYHILSCAYNFYVAWDDVKKVKQSKQACLDRTYKFEPENPKVLKWNTISELLRGQFEGVFTCKDIVNTYSSRCYKLGRKYNYTSDELFDIALEEAEKKDKELKDWLDNHKDPYKHLGKLHGIPFSCKDHIWVEGSHCSIGYKTHSHQIVNKDAHIVKVFRKQGAIPLVKTHTPDKCLSEEIDSSVNPWNKDQENIGRSGSESALISSNCVPFGIWSDMLKGIEVPSPYYGICSFRPTPPRVYVTQTDSYYQDKILNMEVMKYTLDPVTKNSGDLTYLLKILYSEDSFKEYPRYPRVPFDKAMHKNDKKLKVGVMSDVAKYSAQSQAVERAIETAAQILEDNEHEISFVELIPITHEEPNDKRPQYDFDSVVRDKSKLYDLKSTLVLLILSRVPSVVIQVISFLLGIFGFNKLSKLVNKAVGADFQMMEHCMMRRYEEREKIIKEWQRLELDAVILPSLPIPTVVNSEGKNIDLTTKWCKFSSYCQFPSAEIPITCIKNSEVHKTDTKVSPLL